MKTLLTGVAALAALGALAAGTKTTILGSGGLVGHDGHLDGGPTAVRIDVQEGRSTGHILVAGEEHGDSHTTRVMRGPAPYPELHISATQIRSIKIDRKIATIEALGRFVSGAGDGTDERVVVKVVVEDERGKKGEDQVSVACYLPNGQKVFERSGLLAYGDIKFGGGK